MVNDMGSLFAQGGLTNPNSALLDSQSQQPTFVGSPKQVLSRANAGLPAASPTATMGTDILNPQNNTPNLPSIGQPSFQQAATAGVPPGGVNALSPGLNKAGKLVTLLTSGLQGALAGRAAQEQAAVQSGGRRAGGVGMAMEAGYNLPWQRQATQQQLAQQRAQTGLVQAEQENVNVPGLGSMPSWLARTVAPSYLRSQAQLGASQIGAEAKKSVAQTQQQTQETIHRYIPVPNVGLFDTQSRQIMPGSEQGITITPEIAKDHNLPDEFIGKPMSLQQLAAVQRSDVFQTVPVMGAGGPALVNRKTKEVTQLGLGVPALGAPREYGDVNNPGGTLIGTGSQSLGQPGVQSASVQVPKKAAAAEVPTKIGDLKLAYSTASQHADLLDNASFALKNGDQQTLNSLKNRFANEFGATGPITAQTIADAYGREITKMLSGGHLTDSEIGSVGKTLNPGRQSYDQLHGVLQAYKALAQSKMNMLNQQKQNAINQAQPKRTGATAGNDPLGIR